MSSRMRVIVSRSELSAAVALALAAISHKTPKEVLTCAMVRAEGDRLTVTGTDLEVWVRRQLPAGTANVESEGAIAVNAARLRDVLRSVDDEQVEIVDGEDGLVTVRTAAGRFELVGSDPAAYPAPVAHDPGTSPTFTMRLEQLQGLLDRTGFCVAKETGRYSFAGVRMIVSGNEFRTVGTDGKRMSVARALLAGTPAAAEPAKKGKGKKGKKADPAADAVGGTVPIKAVRLIEQLWVEPEPEPAAAEPATKGKGKKAQAKKPAEPNDAVRVTIGERTASFEVEGVRIVTALVEGVFPPYEEVIPKSPDRSFVVPAGELLDAVKRARLFTSEESKGVVLTFGKRKGLVVNARSPGAGQCEVVVDAGKYTGPDQRIAFNPDFLIDGIKAARGADVTLAMNEPNRPGLITAADSAGDFLYVVMPVNLDGAATQPAAKKEIDTVAHARPAADTETPAAPTSSTGMSADDAVAQIAASIAASENDGEVRIAKRPDDEVGGDESFGDADADEAEADVEEPVAAA